MACGTLDGYAFLPVVFFCRVVDGRGIEPLPPRFQGPREGPTAARLRTDPRSVGLENLLVSGVGSRTSALSRFSAAGLHPNE